MWKKIRCYALGISAFAIFSLSSCSPGINNPSPPYLSLLPYSSTTHFALFSIRGKKNAGDQILLNDRPLVPADNSSFWSAEIPLSPGPNQFRINSLNPFGSKSDPAQVLVTFDPSSPSSPVLSVPSAPVSSWNRPVPVQGTKDAGSSILMNGKEIVSYSASTLWSYTYTPQGTATLRFSARNRLGNSSPDVAVTLNYTGPLAPRLVAPLDEERVRNSAATPFLLFSWTGSLSQTFTIQIAATPDFSTTLLSADTFLIPYTLDFSNPGTSSPFLPGIYYWRIGAHDSSGNVYYSPARRFLYGLITGDLNGDGYADILIGAENAGTTGEVRIFFGGPNPPGGEFTPHRVPDLVLKGENEGDRFGTALATGDLNGDGYDDIIVGAYFNSAAGARTGRVYIYFGGPGLHPLPDLVLTGFYPGEQFGVSVASGRDVNGDGYDDLLVGANLNSVAGTSAGRAYLFLGGPGMSQYPDMVFTGESPNDHFGVSVSLAGDVNGDGFSEILVGAGGDGTPAHIGKAYLFSGGFEPGNQPQLVLTGDSPGDGFGRMVAGVRDVNADGYDDFVTGAPFHAGPSGPAVQLEAGEAYLFLGGPGLSVLPSAILRIPPGEDSATAEFGFSAASLGDFPVPDGNGFLRQDGFADFVIGAYGQITVENQNTGVPETAAGEAHLFRGGTDPNQISSVFASLQSGNSGTDEYFSVSIASPGDVNGDGFNDLIVGAMMADQTTGRAYYFGGSSLYSATLCSACVLFGLSPYEGFGFAVE